MSNTKVEYYQDHAGEWRWRVRNFENKEIVDAATEGFATKQKAQENYVTGRQ